MTVPCVWTPGCGIPEVLYEWALKRRLAVPIAGETQKY